MEVLNIAFCDDDKEFLYKIVVYTRKILRNLRINAQIHTYIDGNDLIASFKNYQPYFDIVFLDINMPIINGKEVAKNLRTLDKKFKLIFITAHEEEALNMLQYGISGFIFKKYIYQELPGIIQRVINVINEDNPQTQIFEVNSRYDKKMIIKLPLNEIIYFECINRKVYLYTKREMYELYQYKFSTIIEKYIPLGFLHIHRTCIVNVKYIVSVDDLEICLDNGTHLPVSRRKKQIIMNKFLSIFSEEDLVHP